ncbi:MAG: hypothetical protein DRH03_00740 [Deltaproteobacteria bacterium]|nr:MAG: hypothetical protein DRH03_00740 [Deltaproteobacteria bacterium]
MKKLSQEILNYFATYTETRFNFKRLVNYKWTNDEKTLDFSLFPEFQLTLLGKIAAGDLTSVVIRPHEHTIVIDRDSILVEIEKLLRGKFSSEYLANCIKDEYEVLVEQNSLFVIGEDGQIALAQNDDDGDEESFDLLGQQKKVARKEGLRTYNLAFRRQFEKILNDLQRKIIEQKKNELNIDHIPTSIFGVTNYATQQQEQLKRIAEKFSDGERYIEEIRDYFKTTIEDIIIYDLYHNLQKYAEFTKLGTLFLFFHMLQKNAETYPIFFIEIECKFSNSKIDLSFPRKLILLNTPAINYFKFGNVLTIPRASSPALVKERLGAMEQFIQTQYSSHKPFILETTFAGISHEKEGFPQIKSRIGLQIVTNEDKKLLDYSEIMTAMELGGASKFPHFIDDYIRGTVPNHQNEIDQEFSKKYPLKNPARYLPESPIPINTSQKRILTALGHEKNNIIVIDGPPGTGKSHTIAALIYWANEQKKSVVVTSHKAPALDVIERMLTDTFRELHPQAKPSLVRLDKESSSINNLSNTLQSAVVGAANDRTLEFNRDAIANDKQKLGHRLHKVIAEKLTSADQYQEMVRKIIEFDGLEQTIQDLPEMSEALVGVRGLQTDIDFAAIDDFIASELIASLQQFSLKEFAFLLDHRAQVPDFLKACETLDRVQEKDQNISTSFKEIPPTFTDLLEKLKNLFKTDIKLTELTPKHTSSGLMQKILGKAPKEDDLVQLLEQLKNLQYYDLKEEIARLLRIAKADLTIDDLILGVEKIEFVLSLREHQELLASYRALPGNQDKSIGKIYATFTKFRQSDDLFNDSLYQSIADLFAGYNSILLPFDIVENNLQTLSRLKGHDQQLKQIWQWIKLHHALSRYAQSTTLHLQDLQTYHTQVQEEIEHHNDQRLKNLNNHLGAMARIKVSYEGGKRFSQDEAEILLHNLSCIIAEPAIISKHFPMTEGLIDILIIDEASQVSIADSISLMLRAKQIVIFGDEYQYGAVSTRNVNAKYSASYFDKIISAYQDDYNEIVASEDRQKLVSEVSKNVADDDLVSETLLKPEPGTILWLKTFDIRTSTLTFAKAIANYSTSLREHFRSFPEIIGYSKEFFYQKAQLELIVNRIRTKPIAEVLQFLEVETKGQSAANTNLDEIDAIAVDLQKRLDNGFKGTIGIITSFKEQQGKLEHSFNERFNLAVLKRDHKLSIWFVGDVQGEERDLIYYSFVENEKYRNSNLATIYPVIGGTADNIRSLKMQRLNVGFSRAKDTMVFVHSQPLEKFSNTRLGEALKYYQEVLAATKKRDFFIEDEAIFDSPMEKKVYSLLLETDFVKKHRDNVKIIPQFPIGKYLASKYAAAIPAYRADFLLTFSAGGKEQTMILEYDGLEYHFNNPEQVNQYNFSQDYLEYDTSRQLELESYGYRFLRLNKFNLRPAAPDETEVTVLNRLLEGKFNNYV